MNQRNIVVLLIGIMVVACMSISGITLSVLYRTSMHEERARLMETAQSQARLIEAIARFDNQFSRNYPGGARSATLSQVIDAHEGYSTFGKTGEFVISERVGENMVFLCRHRDLNSRTPEPIPFKSELAEPMRRALSGQSGTVVGLDYGGEMVLAAYEPVAELDLGIVAKIDLSEVREPFVRAGLIVLFFTGLVVLVGAGLFIRIARPMVVRLEEQNAAMSNLNIDMAAEIAERKRALKALSESEQELAIRNHISEILLTAPEEDMYREVINFILKVLNSDCGTLAYTDAGRTRVVAAVAEGNLELYSMTEKEIVFPEGSWGGHIWARCLQEKRAIFSEGPFDLPQSHIPLTRVLAVPIRHKGVVIGSLMVGNRPSTYNEDDSRQLESIANFIAPVVAVRQQKQIVENKRQVAERKLQDALDRLEQRVAERTKQLNKNRMLLQHVFDGIPDPLFLLDENMRIKILNKAASLYYKADIDDVIDTTCHQAFSRSNEPCDRCQVPEAIKKRLNVSYERQGRKDPNRLEKVTVYQIHAGKGRFEGAILRVQDITEAKLLERRQTQNEKLASLGLMVSSIAHEIANPVGAVTFNAPILDDYVEAMLPIMDDHAQKVPDFEVMQMPYAFFRKDVRKIVENILHAAHRIKATVDDLRRLYIQRKDRAKSWVDLGDIIDGVISVIGVEFNQSVKHFQVNIPENIPKMYTDVEAMEQIMTNLLTNAMHAADKEASSVTIHARMGQMWQEYFIIEVTDNGSGMDADTLDRVFKPFFTTKAPGKGTGLGLYVCQDLLEGLGGKMDVASELGKGTVVRIVLPDIEKRSAKRIA